jgi:RsiW-degrading membrane proteinase PrsW (M82 family)
MQWLLLGLTIGPGIFILLWVYFKDRYEKEPPGLVIRCFLGGIFSTVPVLFANALWTSYGFGISDDFYGTLVYAFLCVGGTEELVKLLIVLLLAYGRRDFNEPFDGIIYAVAVSMGFATAENLIYVFWNSAPGEAMWVALLRMITAVPAHATFAILMGYFLGISKFREEKVPFIFFGFIAATLFHGAYDFFLFVRNIPGISIGAFVSLWIGIRFSKKAMYINRELSPFKNKEFES